VKYLIYIKKMALLFFTMMVTIEISKNIRIVVVKNVLEKII